MAQTDYLVIDPGDESYREGKYFFFDKLYLFIDSASSLTIEEVAADSFQHRFEKDTLGLVNSHNVFGDWGVGPVSYWTRLSIASRSDRDEEWLISFAVRFVDFYIPLDSNRFEHHRSGTGLPLKERAFGGQYGMLPALPLILPARDSITLFFKLKGLGTETGNEMGWRFHEVAIKPGAFFGETRMFRFKDVLLIGILVAVAVYHLIILFFQPRWVNLFFSLYVLIIVNGDLMVLGYWMEVFPAFDGGPGIVVYLINYQLLAILEYLFSRSYLRLPALLPGWDLAWAGLLVIHSVTTVFMVQGFLSGGDELLRFLDSLTVIPPFRRLLEMAIMSLALLAAALALTRKQKGAWVYLVAMSVFHIPTAASFLGALQIFTFPLWVYQFRGETWMALLFAMGIASQLKSLQREKVEAEKEKALEHAEALRLKEFDAFKTRFFTNITHQFRTPLTIILGMADQIGAHPTVWAKKGTDMIRRNGERLLNLVNQILDLSRMEAGQMPIRMVQADLVKYIRYIVESFHSSAQHKRIELSFSANRQEMALDYDPDKVMDILSNLISNAIKFTPEGGKVGVRVELAGKNPETLHISVHDNGPGIPQEALGKVFDRYFQVSTVGGDQQGTGLGLALTKELVHLLGGEIRVESEEGKGTAFFVLLAVTRNAPSGHDFGGNGLRRSGAEGRLLPEKEAVVDKTGANTLLLVEDSPDVVAYLQALLSGRFQLLVAENGREGLEMARKHIPDLIVSDIMMPEMDGLEMSRQLKGDWTTSHIPIILLTARSDQQSLIEGLRTGADAYLAKPFDKTELMVRIDKLIELRAKLQERYSDLRFLFQDGAAAGTEHPEDRFIRELQRIIQAHLGDPDFGVPELCRELGVSRAQCYRKFKAITNQSLADFIRRVRLHKARQLLETSGLNVTEVAAASGFANLSSFSRSFKEEFGITPRDTIGE